MAIVIPCPFSCQFSHIPTLTPKPKIDPSVTNFNLSTNSVRYNTRNPKRFCFFPILTRASVGSAEYVVEPVTNVKFPKELRVPGCSDSLVLLGTGLVVNGLLICSLLDRVLINLTGCQLLNFGYREKSFAIIGVKVYAAGFYANHCISQSLSPWKGKSAAQLLDDSSLFSSIFQAPLEKSLKIMLVRDVDGKTFWDALNDVISLRIKEPTTVDESALSTFLNTFQGLNLKKGTLIFLTWVDPSKMLVSISSDGFPTKVDSTIESLNVTLALYDAFFGDSPVSPTLKTSVSSGLAAGLSFK